MPSDDKSGRVRVALAGFVLVGALAAAWAPTGAQAPPPHATWLTLHTPHFRVTFPEGLRAVAERAGERAERAYAAMREGALPEPATPIELLVTDHVDLSNGFASAAPYNRIVIWVSPPLDGMALSHFDDWLELVIVHELAHIFHLDYPGTPGRIARALFGRAPRGWPFVMGFTMPTLAIEGYAVHRESELTESGRLHGSFHTAIVRAHALDGGVESVDRGIGTSPVWPGGSRPYVYGSLFLRDLAARFGNEAVERFLRAAADQWIPYRLDAAAEEAFGAPFTELWREWAEREAAAATRLRDGLPGPGGPPAPERLTSGARGALHPVPHPSGDGRVAYSRSDARSDPRLVERSPDGRERTVARWNGPARASWTPEGELLAPQLEYVDSWYLRSDLFRVSPGGDVVRLTGGLRVSFADAHPTDGRIVAVVEEGGDNRLVLLDRDGGFLRELRGVRAGVLWSHPRWSPDGSRIAVARWRAGGWTGIRVLDDRGRLVAELGEDRSLNTGPTWSPDGRRVLWSSDRTGVLDVYARELDAAGRGGPGPLRQVTRVATAAHHPVVDPGGDWIYLSLLGPEGWDLARVPYDPENWTDPLPPAPRFLAGGEAMAERHDDRAEGEVTPYSALHTLRPRYWLPRHESPVAVAGVDVLPRSFGFETSATDLVGRHAFALEATAPLRSPSRRLEGQLRYTWSGAGNPSLFVEAGQGWRTPFLLRTRPEPGAPLDSLFHTQRERFVGVGARFRHQRMRRAASLTLSTRYISAQRTLLELDRTPTTRYRLVHPRPELLESRALLSFGTARGFPFSVSRQEGLSVTVSLRDRREVGIPDSLAGFEGVDASLRDAIVIVRGYRGFGGPGFASHVVAVRAAGGTSRGPGAGDAHFAIGGGGGGGSRTLGFTWDADRSNFPVRGFPVGTVLGRTAWGATAEWRFPLAVLHRGAGAWPLHLDRLAGGVFVEGAGARSLDDQGRPFWVSRASTGAELLLGRSFLFESPGWLRGGVAVPLQGPGDVSVYFGYGWTF